MTVDLATLDPGLYWFHATGPDGPVVLLVDINNWTPTALVVDDACSVYPYEGDWLHKWRVYAVEPVVRPDPLSVLVRAVREEAKS